jgi:hypothetical protein
VRFHGLVANNKFSFRSDVGNNHLTGTLRDFIGNGNGFPSLRNLYVKNITCYQTHLSLMDGECCLC